LITNKGKNILAKYLIGQSQSYASHIALGIGPRPTFVGSPFSDFSEKEQLDFEVLRTPITSRGFVYDEEGNPNIVFVAELPSEQRYEFTEIGVYPARSNPSAQGLDSRSIYTFSEEENWEYHVENSTLNIVTTNAPLNQENTNNVITFPDTVFRTNSNNSIFASPIRVNRYESPRFLNTSMLLRGDMSNLVINGTTQKLEINPAAPTYGGSHIHYNGISLNFDSNSTEDELRLAFSLINKKNEGSDDGTPQSVRMLIEFVNADVPNPTNFAKFEFVLNQSSGGVNFGSNRYFVIKKKFSEIEKSSNFTWNAVNSVRIYSTVIEAGSSSPSENFYIALDGLRFENVTIKNPLYGLTGYSVIKTLNAQPILKEANTSSSIEFRFALGVD
jgi:hypothetical protein